MRKGLTETDSLKNNSKITTSKRGRERLILLNVPKNIEEDELVKIIGEELEELGLILR